MSRSGYSDDLSHWELIRWRGAVASAIKGARGQAMLRELIAALDALPEQRLAADSLVTPEGEYCALGALGRARGADLADINPEDRKEVAKAFGIAEALAAEVMYLNDEEVSDYKWVQVTICGPMRSHYPHFERHTRHESVADVAAPSRRWHSMRNWAVSNLTQMPEE